jgi:hypothetical protein
MEAGRSRIDMSDILLDRDSHDLAVIDGDLQLVRGVDLIRQRLKQRILTISGEWFLDENIGLPWFQEFSQKGIDDERVKAAILRVIAETQGVSEVVEFDMSLDRRARKLMVSFRVTTTLGDIALEVLI